MRRYSVLIGGSGVGARNLRVLERRLDLAEPCSIVGSVTFESVLNAPLKDARTQLGNYRENAYVIPALSATHAQQHPLQITNSSTVR